MSLVIQQLAGTEAGARALAAAVANDLRRQLAARERALLLVSGGRSPLPFFAALREESLPWERIDISLVDERAVPPDHPDANAGLVAAHLLVGPVQRARWIPLIPDAQARGTDTLDKATDWQLAQDAAAQANAEPALAAPACIVLGMGTDGHTASLFADSRDWHHASTTTDRYVALRPNQAPHARVGLSLSSLISQGECTLWSGGAAKMDTLKRVKMLASEVEQGRLDAQRLVEAGPLALLIAHPKVTLHVFHSNE